MNDKINTRNLLRRKRMNVVSTDCVLCGSSQEETCEHLFFTCHFAQLCWSALHMFWDLSLPVIGMIEEGRGNFSHRSCYMEVVILACWSMWTHRNNIVFDNGVASFPIWKQEFRTLFAMVVHRAKPSLKSSF